MVKEDLEVLEVCRPGATQDARCAGAARGARGAGASRGARGADAARGAGPALDEVLAALVPLEARGASNAVAAQGGEASSSLDGDGVSVEALILLDSGVLAVVVVVAAQG